jgi:hypothetical protein
MDGGGGVADRVPQPPRVVQLGEASVAALGAQNLREASGSASALRLIQTIR